LDVVLLLGGGELVAVLLVLDGLLVVGLVVVELVGLVLVVEDDELLEVDV
jgi:hypothetical protein